MVVKIIKYIKYFFKINIKAKKESEERKRRKKAKKESEERSLNIFKYKLRLFQIKNVPFYDDHISIIILAINLIIILAILQKQYHKKMQEAFFLI